MRSSLGLVALGLGLAIGLLPVLYAIGSASEAGGAIFLVVMLGFALLPYAVFAGVHDGWSRRLAVTVLVMLAALHLAATLWTFSVLEEDALNGLLFFYPGPLLTAGIGVVDLLHRLGRGRGRFAATVRDQRTSTAVLRRCDRCPS